MDKTPCKMRLQTPIRAKSTPFFKIINIFTYRCCQVTGLRQNILQIKKQFLPEFYLSDIKFLRLIIFFSKHTLFIKQAQVFYQAKSIALTKQLLIAYISL